jgi:hypothetical protein
MVWLFSTPFRREAEALILTHYENYLSSHLLVEVQNKNAMKVFYAHDPFVKTMPHPPSPVMQKDEHALLPANRVRILRRNWDKSLKVFLFAIQFTVTPTNGFHSPIPLERQH